jgi:hypothetical protein
MMALAFIGFIAFIAGLVMLVISAIRKRQKKVWLIVSGIAFVVMFIGAFAGTASENSSSTTQVTPKPSITPVIEVDAPQMYIDYKTNEIAADAKYKSKLIRVTGIVVVIDSSPYISLAAGPASIYGLDVVRCNFDSKYKTDLAQLSKGQTTTVQGMCKGYSLNVILENCILINSTSTPSNKQ